MHDLRFIVIGEKENQFCRDQEYKRLKWIISTLQKQNTIIGIP